MSNKGHELHDEEQNEQTGPGNHEGNEQQANAQDDTLAEGELLNDDLASDGGKLADMKAQLQEANDKYLRLVAEFDNFRKRNAKERIELVKNASEDMIKSLLEVLDDSDRAMKQLETSEDVSAIKEGISLVFTKFRNILSSKGLQVMESKGKDFDAELHEAVTEVPAPTEAMAGKVIDEVSKGYMLNDKIIRHPKVVVGK